MTMLGAQTLADIVAYPEQDLLKMKNFGVTSLQEIKTKLASLGLNLKQV